MSSPLKDYNRSTANWREIISKNSRRTYLIIGLFFLIYAAIGVLVDTFLYSQNYPEADPLVIVNALFHLQLFPTATIIMFIIASISLLVSYWFHDRMMLSGTDYHEVTQATARNVQEQQLYNTVEEMKIAAGLRYMPRVYLIEADYMNAFASGYSEKSAMVAITRGLMEKLNRDELQAVMAHELSHINHLDIKVTMTAALLANFSIMILDILFRSVVFRRSSSNKKSQGLVAIIMLLRFLLPIINILLLLYLSRTREIMADSGAVQLMRNNEALASALLKIQDDHSEHADNYREQYNQTPHESVRREAYFFDPMQAGLLSVKSINDLFSTHPTIEQRLEAIGFKKKNS